MTAFHGLIRSREGEPYGIKRGALEALVMDSEHSPLGAFLLRVFGEERFLGTNVRKAQLASELLDDRLSEPSWRLIRDRFRSLAYLTDRRHTEEYAFDLVMGWVQEEVVISALLREGKERFTCRRVGIDATREFSPRPRADADLLVASASGDCRLDLFCDANGYWRRTGHMDLKKGKIDHLGSGRLHAVLGLDLVARTFHWVDREMIVGRFATTRNSRMGNNAVVEVPLPPALKLRDVAKRLLQPG